MRFAAKVALSVVASASLAIPAHADVTPDSTISALAGACQVPRFSGDEGPASAARVDKPRDTEIGPDGSIFVADTYNNRIRKISPDGTITTVAGNGSQTYNGDGIAATAASLYWPHDLFVDDNGNMFIADSNHNRIREITPDGVIHTIAGTGTRGYSGDGGLATKAKIKNPKSVFEFGGYLYVADLANVIRRVDLSTGVITTYAGMGLVKGYQGGDRLTATFNSPQRIQVDSAGNLYVADTLNHAIRRIDAATGIVTTIAGTGVRGFNGTSGQGTNIQLNQPRGIALDGDGILFVADSNNQRIRRISLPNDELTTVAGRGKGCAGDGGAAIKARFYQPRGLTVTPAGDLIIADTLNSMLRLIQQ
jgi:hypothetical protein